MIEDDHLNPFLEVVERIKQTPTKTLITSQQTPNGYITFNQVEEAVIEFKDMLSHIEKESFSYISITMFTDFQKLFNSIVAQLDYMMNLRKTDSSNDNNVKQHIANFFNLDNPSQQPNNFIRIKNRMWTIISFSLALRNKNSIEIEDFGQLSERLRSEIIEAEKNVTRVNKIVEDAQAIATKGGVEKHAQIFFTQASTHSENSKKWFWGAIVLLFLIIGGLITSFCIIVKIDDIKIVEKIQTAIFSAVVGSLLSYGISLCVKNYFAEKHNETINRHKANCLSTFNAFSDSSDGETKAAILLQTTQTIFSHQSPGFLSKGTDVSNPNPIIEIVKNFGNKSA